MFHQHASQMHPCHHELKHSNLHMYTSENYSDIYFLLFPLCVCCHTHAIMQRETADSQLCGCSCTQCTERAHTHGHSKTCLMQR